MKYYFVAFISLFIYQSLNAKLTYEKRLELELKAPLHKDCIPVNRKMAK
ncbi:MAG: hypothetical protein ACPG21_04445 [Crocinitomicaceae bacterium]